MQEEQHDLILKASMSPPLSTAATAEKVFDFLAEKCEIATKLASLHKRLMEKYPRKEKDRTKFEKCPQVMVGTCQMNRSCLFSGIILEFKCTLTIQLIFASWYAFVIKSFSVSDEKLVILLYGGRFLCWSATSSAHTWHGFSGKNLVLVIFGVWKSDFLYTNSSLISKEESKFETSYQTSTMLFMIFCQVFLDEVNTSTCGGLLKEVLVDHRIMGQVFY